MVPSEAARPVEWTFSGPALVALLVAIFLLVALFGFLLTRVGDLARKAEWAERLSRRNAELEESLQKVLALEQELAELRAVDRQIRSWAGLSAEPAADPEAASPEVGADALSKVELALLEAPAFDPKAAGIDPQTEAAKHPLRWPVEGWISSEFRELRADEGPHSGIDIVAAPGLPVTASAAGRVVVSGRDPQYGRVIVLDHGDDLLTYYGHNAELLVHQGDVVAEGQGIASVGSTGRSSAPHLHFEVRKAGCALDPRLFLAPRD